MLAATMNIIGGTSLTNMKMGSQGSASTLRGSSASKNPIPSSSNLQSQNLQSTIVLEEDEKAIS